MSRVACGRLTLSWLGGAWCGFLKAQIGRSGANQRPGATGVAAGLATGTGTTSGGTAT